MHKNLIKAFGNKYSSIEKAESGHVLHSASIFCKIHWIIWNLAASLHARNLGTYKEKHILSKYKSDFQTRLRDASKSL